MKIDHVTKHMAILIVIDIVIDECVLPDHQGFALLTSVRNGTVACRFLLVLSSARVSWGHNRGLYYRDVHYTTVVGNMTCSLLVIVGRVATSISYHNQIVSIFEHQNSSLQISTEDFRPFSFDKTRRAVR